MIQDRERSRCIGKCQGPAKRCIHSVSSGLRGDKDWLMPLWYSTLDGCDMPFTCSASDRIHETHLCMMVARVSLLFDCALEPSSGRPKVWTNLYRLFRLFGKRLSDEGGNVRSEFQPAAVAIMIVICCSSSHGQWSWENLHASLSLLEDTDNTEGDKSSWVKESNDATSRTSARHQIRITPVMCESYTSARYAHSIEGHDRYDHKVRGEVRLAPKAYRENGKEP